MQYETPAEWAARQARCRELARPMTQDEAFRTATQLGKVGLSELTRDERDRFVAANMVLRGEVTA